MQSSKDIYINSLGMQFVSVESGSFRMGIGNTPLPPELTDDTPQKQSWKPDLRPYLCNGDFDEYPQHMVTITQPFQISSYQETNIQNEQFDPTHIDGFLSSHYSIGNSIGKKIRPFKNFDQSDKADSVEGFFSYKIQCSIIVSCCIKS